ncbi:MAG: hypothetical protein CUN55_02620 [Phototrophicales bacterium]|nr:MAG: hypothetical protein CUN55_02620 [Phototrophicales bacterium]
MASFVNWFEIPVLDLERAVQFYNAIFDIKMQQIPETQMYMFPTDDPQNDVSGALVKGEGYRPLSEGGAVIYLNASGKLDEVLARVEEAGGKIALPRTDISPFGFMAFIIDSEGNRVGLHSD